MKRNKTNDDWLFSSLWTMAEYKFLSKVFKLAAVPKIIANEVTSNATSVNCLLQAKLQRSLKVAAHSVYEL